MEQELIAYFEAERLGMIWLMLIGSVSLGAALLLWRSQSQYRLAYWPCLVMTVPQLGIGAFVYFRTQQQLQDFTPLLVLKPNFVYATELERIIGVVDRFDYYRAIELVAIAICLLLMVVYRKRASVVAITLALSLETTAMFFVDGSAEARATIYRDALLDYGRGGYEGSK